MLTITNSSARMLAALATMLVVAACTTQPVGTTGHGAHHPVKAAPGAEAGAPQSGGSTTSGRSGGGMMGAGASGPQEMNMDAMCATHRSIQNAPPEQRQSMMEQHMKGMSPEMRMQHMERMRQQCK